MQQFQKATKLHQVVKIGNSTAEHLLKCTPSYYEQHQDYPLQLYCIECKQAICMVCNATGHKNHTSQDVNTISEEFRQILQTDKDNICEK